MKTIQCSCYEIEGDNPNCPVHYPKDLEFWILFIVCAIAAIPLAIAIIVLVTK